MIKQKSQPKTWRKVKLGEVADLNPTVRLKKGKSYSFIPMEIIDGANKHIKPNTKKRFDGGGTKFSEGDVLFARITPCLEHGKVAVAKELEEGVGFGSTEYFIFRGKENITNTDFLYYISKTNKFKQTAINSMVGVSGRQRARIEAIQNYELNLPTTAEQKRIAGILSAFDEKIELNNKINQTLEQMASAIFKEWFVKFKFPGYEKAKMVDSELGKIPNGWEVKILGEILSLEYGEGLTSVNRKKGNIPVYGSSGIVGYHDKKLVSGPGIIIGRAGIPGSVHWSNSDFHCVDSTFYVETKISKYFLFYLLKRQNLKSLISGSAVPGINRNIIYPNRIILPSPKIINNFDKIISPIFSKIYNNNLENQKLAALRDLLLPKLMSGEIKV